MTAAAIEKAGVVPSGETALRCSRSGSEVTVNAGTAVFSSGVVFTVTGSEKVHISLGSEQYIYLLHDFAANRAAIEVGRTAGVESETRHVVPLCHISALGTLEDARRYAVGKLKAVADWNGTRRQEITITRTAASSPGALPTKDIELLLGGDKINFLVFLTSGTRYGGLWFVREINGKFVLIEDADGEKRMREDFHIDCAVTSDDIIDKHFELSNFRREDGRLMCTVKWYDVAVGTSQNITVYSSVCGGE